MGSLPTRSLGRIRSPIDIGFIVGVTALVLVGLLSLRSAASERGEGRWVEHTYQVINELDHASEDLDRARATDALERDLVSRIQQLRALTTDNPSQRARLDTIGLLLAGHRAEALRALDQMQTLEEDSLDVRSRRTEESNRRSIWIIVASTVLAVAFMTIALRLLHDDLGRRRVAEQALVESEAKHRLLMQQAADAILIVDHEATCLDANDRAAEILARSRNEIVGQPLRAFVRSDRPDAGFVLPMLRYGHVTTGEFVACRADGSTVPVEIRATILDDGRVQIIARDISERKEVERMKDEFVSVVSHELRTPLTSIRGALGLLASDRLDATPDRRARMLALARENADRLIRLVNDILDVERFDSGAIQFDRIECDPRKLIEHAVEVMRPVADRAGVAVEWTSENLCIWADPDRMTQTLVNLIDNAVKFSPPDSTIHVCAHADGDMAVIAVRDEGRGIPPDKRDLVFKRFQQVDNSDSREKGGTGLGLAIARSIVEQHGGKMWIADDVEVGSKFCFTIPLMESVLAAVGSPVASSLVVNQLS